MEPCRAKGAWLSDDLAFGNTSILGKRNVRDKVPKVLGLLLTQSEIISESKLHKSSEAEKVTQSSPPAQPWQGGGWVTAHLAPASPTLQHALSPWLGGVEWRVSTKGPHCVLPSSWPCKAGAVLPDPVLLGKSRTWEHRQRQSICLILHRASFAELDNCTLSFRKHQC